MKTSSLFRTPSIRRSRPILSHRIAPASAWWCGAAVAGALLATPATQAALPTWKLAVNGNWTDLANWNGQIPLFEDFVTFNATGVNGNELIFLNGNQAAAALTFANTGTTGLLGGVSGTPANNTLTLSSGITVNAGAGAVTIGDPTGSPTAKVDLVLTANQSFTNNSTLGALIIANGVSGAGITLTTNGGTAGAIVPSNLIFTGNVSLGNLLAQGNANSGGTYANNDTTTFTNATLTTTGNVVVGRSNLVFGGSTVANIGGVLGNGGASSIDWAQITIQGTASVTVAGGVHLNANNTTGQLLLTGGTLTTPSISAVNRGATESVLRFDGTQVIATKNNPSFVTMGSSNGGAARAYLGNAGALLNTNGFNIGIGVALNNNAGATGFVTKTGLGTLTLSAANGYTGGTTVSAGRITATVAGALGANGGLNVANNAGFTYQPTAVGALTIGSGVLTLGNNTTFGAALGGTLGQSAFTSTAAAVVAGSNIIVDVYGVPSGVVTTGVHNLLTVGSGLNAAPSITLGNIYNATNFTTTGTFTRNDTTLTLDATAATALTAEFWKGGYAGGGGVWALGDGSTASNWASTAGGTVTSLIPGSTADVTFSATGATNTGAMTLGANMTIRSLTVSDAGGLTLNADSNRLTIANAAGITVAPGAGAVTLNADLILGASQTWTNNSLNLLTIAGGVATNNNSVTVTGSGRTLLSGGVFGNGGAGVIKTGTGVLTFTGINAFRSETSVRDGTLVIPSTASISTTNFRNAYDNGVAGTYNSTVYTSGIVTASSAGDTLVAQANAANSNVTGTIYQTGGTFTAGQDFYLGLNNANNVNTFATGTFNISGGTLTVVRQFFMGGYNSGVSQNTNNTLNINGGLVSAANNGTGSFYNNALSGRINVNTGGILRTNAWNAGNLPAGGATTLSFNGGILQTNASSADFLNANTSAVTLFAGGATIDTLTNNVTITNAIGSAADSALTGTGVTGGTAVFSAPQPLVFTGGTGSGASGYATLNGAGQITGVVVTNAGSYTAAPTVSIAGFDGTVLQPTLTANSAGALTKTGNGTLTLTGASTYTGATLVSAGTLLLADPGSINGSSAIHVNGPGAKLIQTSSTAISPTVTLTNGTLDGTGTYNAVTVASNVGNVITHGNGTSSALTIGNLTFNDAATLNLSPLTIAPVLLVNTLTTGALNGAGKITINASSGTWVPGAYDLISYNGSIGGVGYAEFLKGTIAGLSVRQSATLSNPAGFIRLTIAGDNPVWTGSLNGTWTTATQSNPKNWNLITSGNPTDYINGDTVTFNDTAVTSNVNISTAHVSPTSVTFDNSGVDYTITSTGGFGIATGSVTKTGTAALTLATANTYAGGTFLNDGILNLNNASALGTGALNIGAGTFIDNTSGLPVTLATANVQNWNGNFTFNGTNALNLGTGAVPLTANRTITTDGAATLTVGGALSGTNFGLTKEGLGKLVLAGNNTATGTTVVNAGTLTVTGGLVGNVTIGDGGTFNIAGGSVILNNANNSLQTGGNNAVFNMSGGTLSYSIGNLDSNTLRGTFTQTGGTVNTGESDFSGLPTDVTQYYLGGSGIYNSSQGQYGSFSVATRGLGLVAVSGSGALNVTGQASPNGDNVFQLTVGGLYGGTLADSERYLIQQGGSVTANGVMLGSRAAAGVSGANGTYYLNAGTLTTSALSRGSAGTNTVGTLIFGGGTFRTGAAFTADAGLTTAINSGGATIDTTGGNLTWSGVIQNGVTGTAGTTGLANTNGVYSVAPTVTFSDPVSGTTATGIAVLNQAGQVFDIVVTNPGSGYAANPTITFSSPDTGLAPTASGNFAAGSGSLSKVGSGTLTLTAVNTYTGATNVTAGTLLVAGTGEINATSGIIVNGATAKFAQTSAVAVSPTVTLTNGGVDGTGTINVVNVASNAANTVANGNGGTGALTIGTLTFADAGALSLSPASTSAVLLTTTLNAGAAGGGKITVNASNLSWTNGQTYNLVAYSSLTGGGFGEFLKGTIGGLTARQSATLTNPAGLISLAIAGDLPVWTGLTDGNWATAAISAPKNWKLQTGGTATDFLTGDTVLFNDTATGTTAVVISGASVSPNSTTFNNSALSYAVSSPGGFGIAAGFLTKGGSGTVTINTNNSYAGGTTVNAGTLNLAGNNNFGPVGLTVNGGTANLSGSNTGAGAVTVNGGLAFLSGSNSYTGGTTVTAGTLKLGHATALGAATSILIVNGGTVDVNGTSFTLSALTGTGGVITDNGAGVGTSVLTLNMLADAAYDGAFTDGPTRLLGLTKLGNNTLTLGGTTASTLTGGVTVTGGILLLQKTGANALAGPINIGDGIGSDVVALGAADQVADSAVLSLTAGASGNSAFFRMLNFSDTVRGITTTVAQSAVIENAANTAGLSILTVDTAGASYSYDGIIRDGNAGTTGLFGLTKAGAGTLTLANSGGVVVNNFNGGTIVDGGTLQLNTGGAIGTLRGAVTVNAGATLLSSVVDSLGFAGGSQVTALNIIGGTVTHSAAGNLSLSGTAISMTGGLLETTNPTGALHLLQGSSITTLASATTATIAAPLVLRNTQPTTLVTVDDGAAPTDLALTGAITEESAGSEIIKEGTGTLALSGAQNYSTLTTNAGTTNVLGAFTGGTATVNANAATNFGTSQTLAALNIGAGAVVTLTASAPFAGGLSAGSAVVPEPGTMGLLLVGALGLFGRRRRMT